MYNITIQYNAVFTGWDSTTYYLCRLQQHPLQHILWHKQWNPYKKIVCLKMLEQFITNILPQLWHMLPFYYSSCLRKIKHSQCKPLVYSLVTDGDDPMVWGQECGLMASVVRMVRCDQHYCAAATLQTFHWQHECHKGEHSDCLVLCLKWYSSMTTCGHQTITKCGWTLLPPSSPNLTPSDYNLSGLKKKQKNL